MAQWCFVEIRTGLTPASIDPRLHGLCALSKHTFSPQFWGSYLKTTNLMFISWL
jgi:hypothetical protein